MIVNSAPYLLNACLCPQFGFLANHGIYAVELTNLHSLGFSLALKGYISFLNMALSYY
jgi:hypothetical protein